MIISLSLSLSFFFWLCWVFIATQGLSLVAASRGYSSLRCMGFSLQWLLLLRSTGSRCVGFSSCGTWAQQLWRTGLVAPRHVGYSRTRDWTRVPCIGRRILNHCATREVPDYFSFSIVSSSSAKALPIIIQNNTIVPLPLPNMACKMLTRFFLSAEFGIIFLLLYTFLYC